MISVTRPGREKSVCPALAMLLCLAAAAVAGRPADAAQPDYDALRRGMIRAIEADVSLTSRETGKKALDPRVMAAMARVPRHEFVSPELRAYGYENHPLPIGYGQTISQPYIVALMTDLLELKPGDRVLEVGTGSGYQAAILAELTGDVNSIEIIPELGESARRTLARLGYRNIRTKVGNGYYGWEEGAPFDAMVVTAAASYIPPPLLRQLKPGGRMVIPVGGPFVPQQLLLVTKNASGEVRTRKVLPVVFVPLTGEE